MSTLWEGLQSRKTSGLKSLPRQHARHLAVLGTGTVGSVLLQRLAESGPLPVQLCLVANSRWRCCDPAGLDPGDALA
ncbi:MAG TPA: hypothetical protein VIM90_09180, partial [Arenimonas sp.]